MQDTVTASAPLEGLHDIVLPEPVSMTPTTVGWLVLAIAAALVIVWIVIRTIRHHQANRYRAAALRELDAVASAAGDPTTRSQSLTAIAPLLKRTALCVFPRTEVASLTGDAWLQFLAESGGQAFTNGAGRLLLEATYGHGNLDDQQTSDLLDASRKWIRHHKKVVAHE